MSKKIIANLFLKTGRSKDIKINGATFSGSHHKYLRLDICVDLPQSVFDGVAGGVDRSLTLSPLGCL